MSVLIKKFQTTGNVAGLPKSGKPRVSDENIKRVAEAVATSSGRTSIAKVSKDVGVSQTSARKILKCYLRMYPYRIHFVQQLTSLDCEKRLSFCSSMLQQFSENDQFLQNILWTDEVHFHLSGAVYSWNTRIWSTSNPYEIQEQPLHSAKVTVWAGFTHDFLLPPCFFEDDEGNTVTVNAARYQQVINNHVKLHLTQRRMLKKTWIQQDKSRLYL